MKLFGFIMAFYVILLSAVPCCSFDDCPEDKVEQTSKSKESDDSCGNCSPFFTCDGCMASAFTIDPITVHSTPPVSSKIYTGYIESPVPEIHYDFWQPPKIVGVF